MVDELEEGAMPGVLKEAAVTTASARARLKPGVHWRALDPTVHLGYRRGVRGGSWLVRWRDAEGVYTQITIGIADDALAADGDQTLNFAQAVVRAGVTVERRRAETAAAKAGPPVTVRMAVNDYLLERRQREVAIGTEKHDARSRLELHVIGNRERKPDAKKRVPGDEKLARIALYDLTERDLSDWRDRRREQGELSPATIQRLSNDLKAALNAAARKHRAVLPTTVTATIKAGLAARKGEKRSPAARGALVILPDADIRKIIAAAQHVDEAGDWQGDLARMVIVLAATGARFGQAARLTVADVQAKAGRLMMPVSHKGNGEKDRTHEPVPIGADVLAALRPAMAGRKGSELLLLKPWWKRDGVKWRRVGRGEWVNAAQLTRAWEAIMKRAKLPPETIPYSLRHSSIVRALKAGLPNRMVAAMHDTSTQMIERHYSVHLLDALDLIAARAVVPLMPTEPDGARVVKLRG